MKLNIIIVGFTIALIMFCLNFVGPVQYLKTHDILVADSNGYYVLYFLLPVLIVVSIPLLVPGWPYPRFKKIYVSLLLLNIISEVLIIWFINADANKVPYTINNMSSYSITGVHIVARNNQNLHLGDIAAGKMTKLYCNCRDVETQSDDTIGFILSYRINNKNIRLDLLGSNENLFDNYVEVRIVNDSMAYKSEVYGDSILWGGIGFGADKGLLPWRSIKKNVAGQ